MTDVKSCGVLVFREQPSESFLLMQHTSRLDLPKGHVDPGETEMQCALRELWEETGIKPEDIELDPNFRFTLQYTVNGKRYGWRDEQVNKTLVVFLATLKRDVPIVCTEHGGYQWVSWNPPHRIQTQTIDPLLAAVEAYRGLA